jgi:hypothetical protein
MWAELIVTASDEYLLENCTRILLPPRVACTTWRSVLLANPGEGGLLWDSVSCWPLAHVPIQHSSAYALSRTQEILSNKKTNPAVLVFSNTLTLSPSLEIRRHNNYYKGVCFFS